MLRQNTIDIMKLAFFVICWSFCWRTIHSQLVGPTECGEMITNYRDEYLTEFPTNSDFDVVNGLNFLDLGDSCNANAQINFRAELRMKYRELTEIDIVQGRGHVRNMSQRALPVVWREMNIVWNKWRNNGASGEAGTRVCNPRRLLGCHESLKKCFCLQDFRVGEILDPEYNKDHEVILARPTREMTIVNNVNPVNRTVCKAVEGSFCDWEIPWLFFCTIPCLGDEVCVGQLGTRGRKICRPCNSSNPELCATDENFYPKFFQDRKTSVGPGTGTAIRDSYSQIGTLFLIVLLNENLSW